MFMTKQNLGQKEKVKKDAQTEITTAYMKLYNALVGAYSARGMSAGRAWYKASLAMRSIILKRHGKIPGFIFNLLAKIFNTHRQTISKKSMLSPNNSAKPVMTASTDIRQALRDFDKALGNASDKYYTAITNTIPGFKFPEYSK